MGRGMTKTMVVITAALLIVLINGISAQKLIVGGDSGWISPSSTDFYELWAAKQSFVVGDTLVFEFATGSHSVATVTSKEAYDKCDRSLDKNAVIVTEGPYETTITKAGQYYYFCDVGSHCENGQKFAATVSTSGVDSPPAATKTPPPSPPTGEVIDPPPTTPAAPPPSAGAIVTSTISATFTGIVLALLS